MKKFKAEYAQYLKNQMNPNKNVRKEQMTEEEFLMNRELIEDILNKTPVSTTKKNAFLI